MNMVTFNLILYFEPDVVFLPQKIKYKLFNIYFKILITKPNIYYKGRSKY